MKNLFELLNNPELVELFRLFEQGEFMTAIFGKVSLLGTSERVPKALLEETL